MPGLARVRHYNLSDRKGLNPGEYPAHRDFFKPPCSDVGLYSRNR